MKTLALPKAGLPSFPLFHQHRLQVGQFPVSCPHGSHQQPSQSAASTPWMHIGSNIEAGIEKRRVSPIQANLFANAESSNDVLAALIQHDGLTDTPTTLKASRSVIIKAENTADGACAAESRLLLPRNPRMFHSEELIQIPHSSRGARSAASTDRVRRNYARCLFFKSNNFEPG